MGRKITWAPLDATVLREATLLAGAASLARRDESEAGHERAFGKVGLKKRIKIKRQGHRSIKT